MSSDGAFVNFIFRMQSKIVRKALALSPHINHAIYFTPHACIVITGTCEFEIPFHTPEGRQLLRYRHLLERFERVLFDEKKHVRLL